MKIWILQTGEPLHIDKSGLRPMRAMNLSNALIDLESLTDEALKARICTSI